MASPKVFYQKTQTISPFLGFFAGICLSLGLFWGLFIAPPDYQQGDAFRILYIHVPTAFLSMAMYAAMAVFSLLLVVWRIKIAGVLLTATAKVGVWMALLALVTGSIWGKPMWGSWWVWDARLTSELILLLLYMATLATASAFQTKTQGDKIVALLTLVGVVDLPIIHYSVYWWNTLHQGATLTFPKPKIAEPMLYPLLLSLVGFACYALWAVLQRAGYHVLLREKQQQWVKQVIEERQL